MKKTANSQPTPSFERGVDALLHEFENAGASEVAPSHRIALEGQAEVLFVDTRLLLLLRDERYERYVDTLSAAEVRRLEEMPNVSGENVVALRLPRDARSVDQVIRSRQPKGGKVLGDLFRQLGQTVERIGQKSGRFPVAGSLALEQVIILPSEDTVTFLPPASFETYVKEQSEAALLAGMEQNLLPEYERFGGVALLTAFEEGLNQ